MGKRRTSSSSPGQTGGPKPDLHTAIGSGTAIISAFAALAGVIVAAVVGYSQIHSAPSAAPEVQGKPSSNVEPPPAPVAVRKVALPEKAGAAIERSKSRRPPPLPPVSYPPPAIQAPIQPQFRATITMPVGIRLRAEPSPEAATVAVIEPNQPILLGEKIGDYFYAELPSGTRGFVRADLVTASRSGKTISTDKAGIAVQSVISAAGETQE